VALSITKNRLLLTMSKVSGGIWVLDNVDRQDVAKARSSK